MSRESNPPKVGGLLDGIRKNQDLPQEPSQSTELPFEKILRIFSKTP